MILHKFTALSILISLTTSVPLNAANIVAKPETTGIKSIGSFFLSLKDKFHSNKQNPKVHDTPIVGRATNAITTHKAATNTNTQTQSVQTAATPYPTTTGAAKEAGATNSAASGAAAAGAAGAAGHQLQQQQQQQQQQRNEGGHQTTLKTTSSSGGNGPSTNSGPSSAVKSEEEEEDPVVKSKEPIWRLDRVTNYAGIGSGLLLGYVYAVTELQSFTINGMPESTVSVKVISTSKFFTDACEIATMSGAPASIILSASSACASL